MAADDHRPPGETSTRRESPAETLPAAQVADQLFQLLAGVESGEFTASAGLVQRLEGILIALQALKER